MRVGLVGAGLMARTHARGWRRCPGALVAVYAPDAGAGTLAAEHGLRLCGSLDELLREVDAVDLCTPTPTHRELTLSCAAAGRHVICEKPIALSPEDARAMIRGCQEAGVRLFIAQVVRFFPQYLEAWRRVQAGEIGEPRVLRLRRVGSPPAPGSWYHDEAQSGGVATDLMIHDLDYARWVAGEVSEVYARQARQGERVLVQATLLHLGGAISFVEGGWAAPAGVFRTSLDLAGTAGVVEWSSDAAPPLRRWGAAPQAAPQTASGSDALPSADDAPYADQLEHAYWALLSGQPFRVTPEDALAALELSLAVRASLVQGRPQPVGSP